MIKMLGRDFVNRYYEISHDKDSFLCVGLDPVTDVMRDRYVIPPALTRRYGETEGMKKFSLDVIQAVAPFTPIIKPNAQFLVYPFSFGDLKEMVDAIHAGGCLALLDAKLSDIGSTNEAALYWIDRIGFDGVTFSPFPGYENGSDVVYRWSRDKEKGIFVLCRMSNPGAHDYQSEDMNGEALYLKLAADAHAHGCNGYVVGCTAPSELGEIRGIIGEDPLILSPGLGPQGGDPKEALKLGANSVGEGLLVSSSRSINFAYEGLGLSSDRYADAAATVARNKRDELNELKRSIF